MSETTAAMIDLAFALDGGVLPREHRCALAAAVEQVLPWLAGLPDAGVHPLNVSAGGGPDALLSGRTRLTLRVPRGRAAAAAALVGAELHLGGGCCVRVGAMQERELRPHGTLYASAAGRESQGNRTQAVWARSSPIYFRRCQLWGFSIALKAPERYLKDRMREPDFGNNKQEPRGGEIAHRRGCAHG